MRAPKTLSRDRSKRCHHGTIFRLPVRQLNIAGDPSSTPDPGRRCRRQQSGAYRRGRPRPRGPRPRDAGSSATAEPPARSAVGSRAPRRATSASRMRAFPAACVKKTKGSSRRSAGEIVALPASRCFAGSTATNGSVNSVSTCRPSIDRRREESPHRATPVQRCRDVRGVSLRKLKLNARIQIAVAPKHRRQSSEHAQADKSDAQGTLITAPNAGASSMSSCTLRSVRRARSKKSLPQQSALPLARCEQKAGSPESPRACESAETAVAAQGADKPRRDRSAAPPRRRQSSEVAKFKVAIHTSKIVKS